MSTQLAPSASTNRPRGLLVSTPAGTLAELHAAARPTVTTNEVIDASLVFMIGLPCERKLPVRAGTSPDPSRKTTEHHTTPAPGGRAVSAASLGETLRRGSPPLRSGR